MVKSTTIKLIGDDVYAIDGLRSLSSTDMIALVQLYQPLITTDGLSLYLSLYTEGLLAKKPQSHHRLLAMVNMSVHQFVKARCYLEQYGLLDTFVKPINNDHSYLYVLKHPKGVRQFLSDPLYARLLADILGQPYYDQTLNQCIRSQPDTTFYENITQPLNTSAIMQSWTKNKEDEFKLAHTKKSEFDSNGFNMDQFLQQTSDFTFPYHLRTQTNLDFIYRMATMYGLDIASIQKGMLRCIKNNAFNAKALMKYCASESDNLRHIDLETTPSAKVLQYYKQGIMLTDSEMNIIKLLMEEYKFPVSIINVLIQYCITHYKKFIKSQVTTLANSLVYSKVSDSKSALEVLEKNSYKVSYKNNRYVEEIPDYEQQEQGDEVEDNYSAFLKGATNG